MKRTLCMPFKDVAGKEINMLMVNPKDGLTLAEVQATQALIIARNIFASANGDFVSAMTPSILISDTAALV